MKLTRYYTSERYYASLLTFKMTGDDVSSRAGIMYVADIDGAEPQAVEPSDKLATTWAALKNL